MESVGIHIHVLQPGSINDNNEGIHETKKKILSSSQAFNLGLPITRILRKMS